MLCVNKYLYNYNSIYNFINNSVNLMINDNPNLTSKKEYWLFYFIKEDFYSSLYSIYNVDIDMDFFGFSLIKKNTRHAVEAFLDLYNLCMDPEYLVVLEYCSKKRDESGKYKKYLYKGQFSIQSKCNIAKVYGEDFQELVNLASECSEYVHPNVFIDVIQVNEKVKKKQILAKLLKTNIFLFTKAYELILKKFNCGKQYYMGCCMIYDCTCCYQKLFNEFMYYINNQLLIEQTYYPNSFYR